MDHSNRQAGHAASPHDPLADVPESQRTNPDGDQVQAPERGGREPGTGGPLPNEWALVCKLAVKQLDRCVSLEPKVLQGYDPDAIHDLRVATRRLQQVLVLLFPSPRSGEIRKVFRGLKRCRRSLSEVRNNDVLLERVDGALARKRTARRDAWEAIRAYLEESRSARLEKALYKLTRANLSALYVRLKECLPLKGTFRPTGGRSGPSGAAQDLSAEELDARISSELRKVWGALEEEIALSRNDPDPAILHRARIASKRVRYLIEVLLAFGVPGSKQALIWLRNLQKHLGSWHDLVVFEETVIEMIAKPAFLSNRLEMALEIERLVLRNRALKADLERKYLEMTADRAGFLKTRDWVRRATESPAAMLGGS